MTGALTPASGYHPFRETNAMTDARRIGGTAYLRRVFEATLLDPVRLCSLAAALGDAPSFGPIAEVGTYRGGGALWLRLLARDRELWIFDTFAGHVASSAQHDNLAAHPLGRFADTSEDAVAALFAPAWSPTTPWGLMPPRIVAGTFPTSLPERLDGLAFVHLDVDVHDAIRDSLVALWPRMLDGGIIVVDDVGRDDCPGVLEGLRAADAALGNELLAGAVYLPALCQAVLRRSYP